MAERAMKSVSLHMDDGWVRIDGALVIEPSEQKMIRLMFLHWRTGKSFVAIAKMFNSQNLKPRSAKAWDNGTIRKIILRNISIQS